MGVEDGRKGLAGERRKIERTLSGIDRKEYEVVLSDMIRLLGVMTREHKKKSIPLKRNKIVAAKMLFPLKDGVPDLERLDGLVATTNSLISRSKLNLRITEDKKGFLQIESPLKDAEPG